MLQNIKKRNKGFTIIEVLIVLAIAGLIMLIVFLAVPALQRNSKNTQRKNDVTAVLGAIQEYADNNQGTQASTINEASDMLTGAKLGFYKSGTNAATTTLTASGTDFNDVNVGVGNAAITTGTPPVPPAPGKMYIRLGGKCNGANNDFGGSGATSRSVAVVYSVESSSSTTGFKALCQNS